MKEYKDETTLLIDVRVLSVLLHIGARTIFRLNDLGQIPKPVRIGRSVRWRRDDIETWLRQGCPRLRNGVLEGGAS